MEQIGHCFLARGYGFAVVEDLDLVGRDDGGATELILDAFPELGDCGCGGVDGG